MGLFDSLTGGAYETAHKNNQYAIGTGLNQISTALGDNYTQANNYILGNGLPAVNAGYNAGLGSLGTGYGNQRIDLNGSRPSMRWTFGVELARPSVRRLVVEG